MNLLRAEALNVLLCFVLGAAVGGVMSVGLGPSKAKVAFDVAPTVAFDEDPGLKAMQHIDDAVQRQHALFNVMSRFALTDLDRALSQLPTDDSHDAVLTSWIKERLLKSRPDLATRSAATIHDIAKRNELIVNCTHRWRRIDSAKTAQWLREHLDDRLAASLTADAMNDDPAFLGRLLLEAPRTSAMQGNIKSLLQQWLQNDATDALRFMETMPPARLTPAIFQRMGTALVQLPAARAHVWLAGLPEKTQSVFVSEVLSSLPQSMSVPESLIWLDALAPPHLNGKPVTEWFRNLTLLAPNDAQAALDNLSPAWAHDDCIEGCVAALAANDKVTALDWTLELNDQQRRFNIASATWNTWSKEARAAAIEWLVSAHASNIFSAMQRGQLMKAAKQGGDR